jgi:hypothetical protein
MARVRPSARPSRQGWVSYNLRTSQHRTVRFEPLEESNIQLLNGQNQTRKFSGVQILEGSKWTTPRESANI